MKGNGKIAQDEECAFRQEAWAARGGRAGDEAASPWWSPQSAARWALPGEGLVSCSNSDLQVPEGPVT